MADDHPVNLRGFTPDPGLRRPTGDRENELRMVGGAFVGFAVDARYGRGGGRWQEDVITGCVYAGTGAVYLRYGDAFRAAGVLLGKKIPPAASHVCRAAGAGAVVAGG